MKQKNLIIAAVAAVVVGGGVYLYVQNSEPVVEPITLAPTNREEQSTNTNTNKPISNTPAGNVSQLKGKNILNLGPQTAGNSLIVDLVNLVKPGFIAVYQADSKGQPSRLVASSALIAAGTSTDLVVKAALKANTTYVITLREDNGDGKFNANQDPITNDVNGKPVIQNITTSK